MNSFNRKLAKLKKNPKLFFADAKINHLKKVVSNKAKGVHHYTIVSAIYNVEKYLKDYFQSIVKQSLSFQDHIHLVLVDDGSTDNSANIIKKWQAKYPDNITCLYKENGGQASARNEGLKHVKTEWVTFVDPDDFLDKDYFLEVDRYLTKNKINDIKMVGCSLVFYFENNKEFRDNHPLGYRFAQSGQLLPYNDLKQNMQLSASTAFFNYNHIKNNKILFDKNVQPNFEDGKFVAFYLSSLLSGHVGFIKEAKYFYRKREDGTSTLDTSWLHKGRYSNVIFSGYLESFKEYHGKLGSVPEYFQRTVLYDIVWYCKHLIDHGERVAFLDENEKKLFLFGLKECFKYIDKKTILDFNLAGCWFFHKVGMLYLFKETYPDLQIAYIEDYDATKNQVLIYYFWGKDARHTFTLNNINTIPFYEKTRSYDFIDNIFVCEHRCWIPLSEQESTLRLTFDGVNSRISLAGKHYQQGLSTSIIQQHFASKRHSFSDTSIQYKDCWLLMDRDSQADDNAEHLYRYLGNHHPDTNAYFVLSQISHDWNRLQQEGFKLLAYGSKAHEQALRSCNKIISSHADVYVTNYFKDNSLVDKDFIFLQHGVIKDDLSKWLNNKRMSVFITSTRPEYDSIVSSGSRYKFTQKEVVLTGLPRHDHLLEGNNASAKSILIMPTWRQSIVGDSIGGSFARTNNPNFMETDFAQHWYHFLHSVRLKALATTYQREVIFFPHANIQPYLKQFKVPSYIKVMTHSQGSIQQLFQQSEMMITDYSSVAFEMAYLSKPVLYYQFDYDTIYSGGHTYSKGYFDYERDGFGPIAKKEDALLDELEKILKNQGCVSSEYQQRIDQTFPFKDGKCCERVYNAIVDLDSLNDTNHQQVALAARYAEQAAEAGNWSLAEQRWQAVVNDKQHERDVISYPYMQLVAAQIMQGKLVAAQQSLTELSLLTPDNTTEARSAAVLKQQRLVAELATRNQQWQKAVLYWQQLYSSTKAAKRELSDVLSLAHCLMALDDQKGAEKVLNALVLDQLTKGQVASVESLKQQLIGQKTLAITTLEQAIKVGDFTLAELTKYKPELGLSALYRMQGLYDQSHRMLTNYEKHTTNDPQCRIEIALLSAIRENWEKAFIQINKAYPEGILAMPLVHRILLIKAARLTARFKVSEEAIDTCLTLNESPLILAEQAEMHMVRQQWEVAISCWLPLLDKVDGAPYRLAMAYRMSGQLKKALKLILSPTTPSPSNQDEWILRGDIAQLTERWDVAVESWGVLLSNHVETVPSWVWKRYQAAQLLYNSITIDVA